MFADDREEIEGSVEESQTKRLRKKVRKSSAPIEGKVNFTPETKPAKKKKVKDQKARRVSKKVEI